MNSARSLVLTVAFSALALAQIAPKDRIVVLISLDGFPAFNLYDPKLPTPTLRRLMQSGVSAPMTTINPTVTWPNHTTLVTGVDSTEHGLLVNGSIVATGAWPPVKVDPSIAKARMVHSQTIYDAAHARGLTTAQVDWVAINDAPTITWPFSEWATPEGKVEREMIGKGAIAESDVRDFTKMNIVWRDQVWTKAAVHLIKEHKPNLLLVHFLSLDSVHHQFGPKNLAALSTMAFLDSCVEKIVAAVGDAGMQDRTTFFVVSDHGFKAFRKEIHPNVAIAQAGLASKAYVVPEGGTAIVYLNDPTIAPAAIKALQAAEGVDKVVSADQYSSLGLPEPARDPQMGQLFVTARDGYAFTGATGGPVTAEVPQTRGSHGFLASDPDMDAIFIASGYGIRAGARLDKIANIDVAPTIAALLGVPLPSAKGKALPILTKN